MQSKYNQVLAQEQADIAKTIAQLLVKLNINKSSLLIDLLAATKVFSLILGPTLKDSDRKFVSDKKLSDEFYFLRIIIHGQRGLQDLAKNFQNIGDIKRLLNSSNYALLQKMTATEMGVCFSQCSFLVEQQRKVNQHRRVTAAREGLLTHASSTNSYTSLCLFEKIGFEKDTVQYSADDRLSRPRSNSCS